MRAQSRTPGQPWPTTSADVHLLVSPGRIPVIAASASMLQGSESIFARLEVDDMPPGADARHRVNVVLSGDRATVLAVLRELRLAVDAARVEPPGQQ